MGPNVAWSPGAEKGTRLVPMVSTLERFNCTTKMKEEHITMFTVKVNEYSISENGSNNCSCSLYNYNYAVPNYVRMYVCMYIYMYVYI